MMRDILTYENTILREVSLPVEAIDERIREIARIMMELSKIYDAFGLAAIQIGERVNVVVLRGSGREPIVMVNPELVKQVDFHIVPESCVSLPCQHFYVKRPKVIKVKYTDLDGKERSLKGHDFFAQIIRHEIDHLDGVMIDQIGTLIK